ncbi:gluconate 2-dehydrogenase subunit 3 family protein [Specibacter sp. RAF43]|uniref:gluconate 2-dehydrogenase subunit 3 family protein n=1 Tax=Specibacter sp. RAF43 TaxID=3233057 RepID=UPI003F9BB212
MTAPRAGDALPLSERDGGGRFPGLHTASLASHWDEQTTAAVMQRLGRQPHMRYLSPSQEAAADALFNQLLGQREEPRIPIVQMVDARLAEGQTDGWHFEEMTDDGRAWQLTLAWLDHDALLRCGTEFADASWEEQHRVLQSIQNLGKELWHDWPATRVWSLWTRYACTAFYSHPWAWDEIGFAGPAYPRGYKNLGLDARDPVEVADARPAQDPAWRAARP